MSTTYPQLFHNAIPIGLLVLNLIALGLGLYLRHKINREIPSKTVLGKLQREIGELNGELGDLGDRFTRFQKREGMRTARAEKASKAELEAEAAAILAKGGGQASQPLSKLDLYRRANH